MTFHIPSGIQRDVPATSERWRVWKGERGREASGDAQNLNLLHFSAGAAGDRTLVCVVFRGLHQKQFVGGSYRRVE